MQFFQIKGCYAENKYVRNTKIYSGVYIKSVWMFGFEK